MRFIQEKQIWQANHIEREQKHGGRRRRRSKVKSIGRLCRFDQVLVAGCKESAKRRRKFDSVRPGKQAADADTIGHLLHTFERDEMAHSNIFNRAFHLPPDFVSGSLFLSLDRSILTCLRLSIRCLGRPFFEVIKFEFCIPKIIRNRKNANKHESQMKTKKEEDSNDEQEMRTKKRK